jgi:ABC-type lipoprotein export system ATPase subunit
MLVSLNDVSIVIDNKIIVESFSLEVKKGEKVIIKGMSGKGKTTLINLLLGFVPFKKGIYLFSGKHVTKSNISDIRKQFALLPQNLSFSNENVLNFIMNLFSYNVNKIIKPETDEIFSLSEKLMLDSSVFRSNMNDISGGEKQRIAIICCLLLKREILLLDEPTSALDQTTKNAVMDLFFKNNEYTIISTSHDDEWASRCDRIIEI